MRGGGADPGTNFGPAVLAGSVRDNYTLGVVNVREAWGELGLEPPCSADQIRRAYLRGLKSRNPESDREGFLRLREAYELLSNLGSAAEEDTPREMGTHREPSTEAAEVEDVEAPASIEIDLGDPVASAPLVIEAFNRFRDEPDRPIPPPAVGLHIFLSLMERRQMKTAGQLYDALCAIAAGMGSARAFGPRASAWALAEALWKQRHEIQRDAFIPMAESIGALAPHRAASALRAFARREPAEARWLYHHLDVKAPELFQLFGPALLPPGAEPSPAQAPPIRSWGRSPAPWAGGFVAGLFMLIRFMSGPTYSSSDFTYRVPPPLSSAALERDVEIEDLSMRANAATEQGDCDTALRLYQQAKDRVDAMGSKVPVRTRNAYTMMSTSVWVSCATAAPPARSARP